MSSTELVVAKQERGGETLHSMFDYQNNNIIVSVFLEHNIKCDNIVNLKEHAESYSFENEIDNVSFASVANFINNLEQKLLHYPFRKHCALRTGKADVLLMGAFMLVQLEMPLYRIIEIFFPKRCKAALQQMRLTSDDEFYTKLVGIWSGLKSALDRSWIKSPTCKAPQQ